MLPGFRFLLAAIVLSISVLVFGLGAAALLRAAHEEFASTPAWRVAPEPKFARQQDTTPEVPVLALLRVEPEPAQPAAADNVPAVAAPAEPPAIAATPDQPGEVAALEPQDKTPPEAMQPDIAVADTPVPNEAPVADTPAPAEEARIATAEPALPPANEAIAPAPEPAILPPAADTDIFAARIAALGGTPVAVEPPVTVETQPAAKAASAKPDPEARKKRLKARRAKERRRLALRARQAAARQQQAADPFAQPTITPRSR
ncbi:hypothetical protein [Bradyrhizobium sp.]|uniref:hypothetical protein n=1 Tax=Bradyrhizobium sp. TaxID=376 RepID=UPI0027365F01|nr:hypothetical protein [Bradyrhizobium sp.]MDP3689888.1 hypothetical protein [Bradyrhizobium sp.]